MSGAAAQNRFAPPRAEVEDQVDGDAVMVDAGRGARLLATLIDGVLPALLGIGMAVAVAIPAYQRHQQEHVRGIEPPALGSGNHLSTTWAWIAGLLLLAYFVYSLVLVYLYGQTVGKRAMGIRVVRVDGSRVAFSRIVFLRWLPLALVGAIPFVGGIVGLIDPLLIFRESRQCLHDDIANTRVVEAATSAHATLRGDPKYAGANLRTISF
jgi:uncharacterized RDD family membrane protein YckC